MWDFIIAILVGGAAGWIAGQLSKGKGFGVLLNIVLGVCGGFVGNLLFSILGFAVTNIIGVLISSIIGALLLIWVAKQLKSR